ncbi:flagellar protein FlgN [uncultured Tolumonas sp.]|uniref:flagella synthesis protein FlgN n=1 Tax=uncultured Tolumonas sp. TaxID=263765 RepID=UPI002A0A5A4B|nr:flagellar protein FlgN [uncultured Tolumonas sp.]
MIDQTLLQQQQKRLTALQEVLEKEFAALKQRQVTELAELANSKTTLLSQLTALDNQARQNASDDEYQSWREHLHDLLRSCREKNEVNGKLIEMNLIASRKLSTILAQARDRDSMTYNDHGLTQPRSSMPLGIKA